jgi:hypothetical protein
MRLVCIPLAALVASTSAIAFAAPRAKPPKRAPVVSEGSGEAATATAQRTPKKRPRKAAPPPPKEPVDVLPAKEPEPEPAAVTETHSASAPVASRPAKDTPAKAEADEPASEPKPISIAPVFGYATGNASIGLGFRGGYTLSNGLYLGGTFVYHLGTSEKAPGFDGGEMETSVRIFYPGAEVGYDISVGPVIIRPYAGLGALFATASFKSGSEESSSTNGSFALWPGCTVMYDFPRSSFFIGGDTRLVIATSGGDPSFGMFATGGMRF